MAQMDMWNGYQKKRIFKFSGVRQPVCGTFLLIMALTGIMLYISPPGRVAHWSNWVLLGLIFYPSDLVELIQG